MAWLIKKSKGNKMLKKMNELTKEQIRKYKIDKSRLIKSSEKSMYVHEVIAIPVIMQTIWSKPETIKFRSDLRFIKINLILKKEQSVIILLLKKFSAEKIKLYQEVFEN